MSVTNGVINVFSGGSAKKTTVNNDAIINIASGCADETNVNGNGAMYIFGGTANRTNLDNGGGMGIYSGGTATSTTVNTNAAMYVFENGSAVSTTISHGWLKVHDGGSANYTTVDMGGSLNVLDGGKATNIIENGGYVEYADDTTVNFMQHVIQGLTLENTTATIHPATTVSETTLGVGCSMYLLGGKAISVTMDSGAIMHVSSGGTATRTAVNSNGLMHVSSGGTATSVTVNSFGVMRVSSGAQATSATVDTNGNMYIMSGAQATSTTVNLGGWLWVYDSGIVNETTVAGIMRVEWGGMATRTTVDSDGTVSVFSGATATSTTVNSGGKMWVISGGTALDVVNSGGRVGGYVLGGDTAVLSGRHQDGTVFYISGGTANNIIGGLFLSNGGIAYNTTVDSGSDLRVMSGCTAAYTTVGNGGSAYVGNGGTMHLSTTVNSGGSLFVDSGGAAFGLVNSGGYVGGVVVGGDTQTFVAGANQDGTVFFISNGVASNVSGQLNVSGGVANHTTVDGFIMQVDGTVNDTTVNSGGTMQLLGGVANYTTLNGSGTLMDVIGASANFTTMNSGASIWLEGGTANRTTMNGGSFSLLSYGVANSTIVNGGYLKLSKGVTANDTIVNSGGSMEVFSSFVNNITVNGGSVGIGYDAILRGNISIASGAILLVNSYAKMDFTVAEQDDPAKPLIDHFDYITIGDSVIYTLTVAAEQASGVYVLAGDANNFRSKSVTVKTVVGDEIGTLSVGGSIKDASRMYSLVMDSDNTLSLKVIKYHTVTNVSAEGEGCFADAAAEGEAILFADAGEYSYTDGLAATKAIEVIGDGADMTTLEGGNFYMNGNEATFSNLTLDGMVFGGTASSYSETGDVALSFSNVVFAEGKRVYGGTDVSEYSVATVGDITLAIDGGNGTAARVFGAGRVADNAFLKVGDISLTVSCAEGGSFLNIFAGADVVAGFSGRVSCDDVSTVIDGGIFTYAGNGSQLRGGESSQKNSTLTVNGGTFNHYVYAGAFSMGGKATVDGDTSLVINGGTFKSHVFGGCGADNSADGDNTSIDGNAAVIVNTSNNTVSFSGNVYAGSMGYGYIDGVTSMTFTGLGSNLTFASGSYVTGNSQMFRRTDQYVSGEQTLAFDGFSGDFGANVNNGFTRFSLKGSNVSFTGTENVTLSRISTWEIEVGSAEAELDLTLSKGKNNFKGDSLKLTLADSATPDSSGWDVIAGTEATLRGWDKFTTVTLCGEEATYYEASGEWSSVSYRLFMEDDTLKLATIA